VGQNDRYQQLAAVNRRLRLPFVHAGLASLLPEPVKWKIPATKPPAIWRMPVWYKTGGSMRCVLEAEPDLRLASSRRKPS